MQDGQLVRLVQAILASKAQDARERGMVGDHLPDQLAVEDFESASRELLPSTSAYDLLRHKTPRALRGRTCVLIALNRAIFSDLLPWIDLSESASAASLTRELGLLRPTLFDEEKRRLSKEWAKIQRQRPTAPAAATTL